jgi:hypothetical protein
MGLAIGESGDFDVGDGFNADDLFSVDTMDETGNNVEMVQHTVLQRDGRAARLLSARSAHAPARTHAQVSGDELTSIVIKQGADKASLDWASELMLLTHEPLRCAASRHAATRLAPRATPRPSALVPRRRPRTRRVSLWPCSRATVSARHTTASAGATCLRCSARCRPSSLASCPRAGACAASSGTSLAGAPSSRSSTPSR